MGRSLNSIMRTAGASCVLLAAWLAIGCGESPPPGETPIRLAPMEASAAPPLTVDDLRAMIVKLEPLHRPLGEPQAGDWLLSHDEAGQTFEQYLTSGPTRADGARRIIDIQPIGAFTASQRRIVEQTAEFVRRYYVLDVRVLEAVEVGDDWPAYAKRQRFGGEQLLTTHILDRVLRPAVAADAAALIGLTAQDLWPGRGWNFVFGQASLRDRVGVWSIARFGDPGDSDAAFRRCLLRAAKVATHELGHMFSMRHCTAYECNLCGSNNLSESDRRPLALCPQCLAKLCYATGAAPRARFKHLAEFCRAHGLSDEAAFFERSGNALRE